MPKAPRDLAAFTANAAEVADILRALANERRLMILCKLVEWGEAKVNPGRGRRAFAVGLSQHLAKMREEGIVTYRRESQTLWYRIADPRTETAARAPAEALLPARAPAQKRKAKPTKERMIMSLPTICPNEAKRLIDQGAILIDIRGRDEHARERIQTPRTSPSNLTTLDGRQSYCHLSLPLRQRTARMPCKLAEAASCEAYIIEGGIEAWKRPASPSCATAVNPSRSSAKCMIAAGSLVLLGVLLGHFVQPAFYAVPSFIGAGLFFAGITGWCGMAKLLLSCHGTVPCPPPRHKLAN